MDLSRAMLVGDSWRDLASAASMGIPSCGVRTGYGCRDQREGDPPEPTWWADDLRQGVERFLAELQQTAGDSN